MCGLELPGLSRRNFGLLAVSALSISAFPFAALAAGHAEALALTCIDYRLVDATVKFYDETLHLEDEYDHVGLAGAALAAVSPKFPSANAAFWDQLQVAKDLHHIKKVIVLDHRDCGAYKMILGEASVKDADAELKTHVKQLYAFRSAVLTRHPHMEVEIGLMALDGTVTQIV